MFENRMNNIHDKLLKHQLYYQHTNLVKNIRLYTRIRKGEQSTREKRKDQELIDREGNLESLGGFAARLKT